jgi:hypothetical protein
MSRLAAVLLFCALALACSGCDKPQPFGKLPRGNLSEWADDCDSPIVELPAVKGPDRSLRGKSYRETTFQHATHRFNCKAPGFTVYVGDEDRIVGFCVDNKVWPKPIATELERAHRLFAKHFGTKLADKLTEGMCPLDPESIEPDLLRWHQAIPWVQGPDGSWRYHPNVGSIWSCCWEVRD